MGLECTFLAPLGAHATATVNSSAPNASSSSSTANNLNLNLIASTSTSTSSTSASTSISASASTSSKETKDPEMDSDDDMNGVTAGTRSLALVKNVGGAGGGAGVGGASSLPVAHPVRAIPALAKGVLPPLSTLDCSAPPEKGISPLRGLAKDKLVEFAEAELGQLMATFSSSKSTLTTTTSTSTTSVTPGVVGLRNLGNTCFMNSILQCLAAVEPLSACFEGERAIREINAVNHMGHGGRLTLAWAAFVRSLRHPTSPVLSPLLIKEFVSEKAPQFTGYQQHDSGEFAVYLLDGLCSDMLRAEYTEGAKHPIKYWEDPVEGGNGRPHAEVAKESWDRYIAREESIITDLFAGMTRSVLTCGTCKSTSVKCDQWTSLILALPNKPDLEKVDFITLPGRGRSEPFTRVTFSFPPAPPPPPPPPKAPTAATTTTTTALTVKTPAIPRRGLTVAEVCTLLGRLERSPGMLPLVPEDLKPTVEADPEAAMAASGYVCGGLSDCVFTSVDQRVSEKGEGKYYFPVEPGCKFIPCNLRIRWDTDSKVPVAPCILPPTHTLYEPIMVSVPPTATTATILDQIWASMARFMAPAFREAHSAQSPPYTVSLLGPVKSQGVGKGDKAEFILSECAKARMEELAYSTSEPFPWDWTTGTLMLVAERPEEEWKEKHVFPSFSSKDPPHPRLPPPGPAWKANQEHPVKFNESPGDSPTLANLLRLYCEMETLSGVEEVFCSVCKAHRATEKALTLWRLPPILIINLKRFKAQLSQYGTLNMEKMYDPVSFPITGLDLSDSLPSKDQWPVPPPVSFHPDALPGSAAGAQEPLPPIYDLFAVSEHGGVFSGGHYVASIQDYATGNWHKMDDSSTRPIHPKEVLTPAAYVLFYRLRGTEGRAVREYNASLPSNLGDVVSTTESL